MCQANTTGRVQITPYHHYRSTGIVALPVLKYRPSAFSQPLCSSGRNIQVSRNFQHYWMLDNPGKDPPRYSSRSSPAPSISSMRRWPACPCQRHWPESSCIKPSDGRLATEGTLGNRIRLGDDPAYPRSRGGTAGPCWSSRGTTAYPRSRWGPLWN
jgi:hypothetical protein